MLPPVAGGVVGVGQAEHVHQPGGVLFLGGAVDLVASGDVLGEVLGQVADAPAGVFRAGEHDLGIEPGPQPGHMQSF